MNKTTAPTLVRKTVSVSDVKVLDEAQGIVEALVNSLEVVDHDGDVILDGAFDRHMERGGKLPKVCWFHQLNVPVGKCLETRQIGTQQWVKAQFNMQTQRGREAFSDVAFGAVDEWSVGFYPTEVAVVERDGKRRRGIKDLLWVEFSPVLVGASPNTGTVSAKDAEPEPGSGEGWDVDGKDATTQTTKQRSFEEIRDLVHNALQPPRVQGMPWEWWWILETYADHVIACQETEGDNTYWSVPYTIAEDGTVTLGEKTEVERVYVPVSRVSAMRDGMSALMKHLSRQTDPAPATSLTADAAGTGETKAVDEPGPSDEELAALHLRLLKLRAQALPAAATT